MSKVLLAAGEKKIWDQFLQWIIAYQHYKILCVYDKYESTTMKYIRLLDPICGRLIDKNAAKVNVKSIMRPIVYNVSLLLRAP